MLSHLITDFCRHWSKFWGQCISSETLHTVDERLGCSCTCFSVVIRHVTRKHLKGKVTIIQLCDRVPGMKNCVTVLIKLEKKRSSQTKSTASLGGWTISQKYFPFPIYDQTKTSPYPIEDLAVKSCFRPAL